MKISNKNKMVKFKLFKADVNVLFSENIYNTQYTVYSLQSTVYSKYSYLIFWGENVIKIIQNSTVD